MTTDLIAAPSEEQRMLLEASVRFIEEQLPLADVRRRGGVSAPLPAGYRAVASELGWFGLLAPSERGGGSASGNGALDACAIAAECGRLLQPLPLAGHSAVVDRLSAGCPAELDHVLGVLAAGAEWATWAFDEQNRVRCVETDPGLLLTGTAGPIADAQHCRWILVTTSVDRGPVQALIDVRTPGVTLDPVEGIDVTRSWFELTLDGVAVGSGAVVDRAVDADHTAISRQTALAAVLTAAGSVGAMHADFELAVQYAKDRIAFGRPIGSFQALKHLLADASLWLEMSKGVVVAAATAIGSGADGGPQLAHAAKSFVGEMSVELAQVCFQVFGGIGYTWEHDQHLYFRRLAADAALFGSPAWHRRGLLLAEGNVA